MRSIIALTIIEYEFICLFNRNMRFYFTQRIAFEQRGPDASVRSPQRMFEK